MSHHCHNLLMTCIDFRFHEAIQKWVKENGLTNDFDLVSLAGVQKSLLDEDTRATVLKQLEISSRLHGIETVIFVAHQDCGAYGGSKVFVNFEEEKAKYLADMIAAGAIIKETLPNLQVKKLMLTFNEETGAVAISEL
ncbi:MAG: carbonic anhydrase [Patescibacteria group bacterium]